MAEKNKVNLNDRILCPHTGKEISGFQGTVIIDPIFNEASRRYSYYNVEFISEGDADEAISNFTDRNEAEVEEFYPIIKVCIESPFSGKKCETLLLRDEDPTEFKNKNRSSSFGQVDEIYESLEFNNSANIPFYELSLPETGGKYRGFMKINFQDIETYVDLLEDVERKAFEDYDYNESPAECLENDYFCFGVTKRSLSTTDELDAYVDDLGYLFETKGSILELFDRYFINGFSLDDDVLDCFDFGLDGSAISMKNLLTKLINENKTFSEKGREMLKKYE